MICVARVFRKVLVSLFLFTVGACSLPSNIAINFGQAPTVKIVSIIVTPNDPSVSLGLGEQLTATGIYSDNSTRDLTLTCTWSHVNGTGSASISSSGFATTMGGGVGTVTITAYQSGVSGSTTLSIYAPVLVSLAITPANPTVALGNAQQFTAIGTYTDSSTQDLTSSVIWSENNGTGSASVNGSGLVSTLGFTQGAATITGTLGTISGSTTLNIGAPILTSIAVTPATTSIPLGNTQQFTATGTYTDTSTQNITSSATWSETNGTGSATVNSTGLAATLGGAQGNVTIMATMGMISGNTTLTISAPVLSSISVTPANSSVLIGNTQQFTATGTFSDASTQDVTSLVSWSETDGTGTATINSSGQANTAGSGTGGTATITATSGSIHGNTTLTVMEYTITTVAGEFWPTIGIGGPASSALLFQPGTVAFDGSGNLYISDTGNNVVRKVSASTGNISNFAGNGFSGYSGDGGPASNARLNEPKGIAFDSSGNLYIADSFNSVIRLVSKTTGDISTFAGNATASYGGDGGLATSASLLDPYGVTLDASNNVYIADTGNSRVREVTAANGHISTVAGTGIPSFNGDGGAATSAWIFWPYGTFIDVSGNIYIADTGNSRIREVSAANGHISTVAGTVTAGYNGDGMAATSAELQEPGAVYVDPSGNIYISDTQNNRIRLVSAATGHISTIAGNGTFGYSGDGGVATSSELAFPQGFAFDSSGNLFISDVSNDVVRTLSASTGDISTFAGGTHGFSGDGGLATSSEINGPTGVAVDSSGNLYISDTNNARIRKVNALTGDISTFAGNGTANYGGDSGAATNAELNGPEGMAVDSSGNLYIADNANCRIRKVAASNGHISTVAGNGTCNYSGDGGLATSAELKYPYDVVVDNSGNLFITDGNNCRIREVAASSGHISTVAGNGTCSFGGDGGAATSAELNQPFGLVIDSSSNIYFTDANNNRIRKVSSSTGNISTVAGNGTQGYTGDGGPATNAELNDPSGIVIDSSDNLYFVDGSNFVVRKVTASTGDITTIAGIGIPAFSGDGDLP